MKAIISTILLGSTLLLPARTWTSADGKKTFEADFISYDATKNAVTIKVEGNERSFDLANFSKDDQDFVKGQGKLPDLGELLSKDVLQVVKDGKFVPTRLEEKPDYYLVYFSASW